MANPKFEEHAAQQNWKLKPPQEGIASLAAHRILRWRAPLYGRRLTTGLLEAQWWEHHNQQTTDHRPVIDWRPIEAKNYNGDWVTR
jgi:hypothetical protein